jgi:hypothetical protein
LQSVRTGFDARRHGWCFGNAFAMPSLAFIDWGARLLGLCGGMCYAALDYWHAGIPIPPQANAPLPGTLLYRYLLRRQLASMGRPWVLGRIAVWMLRADGKVAALSAGRELEKLRRRIDAGEPAVLLLLRAGGLADPTRNHQAVATDYTLDKERGQLTLWLYDPNHPEPSTEVQISLTLPTRERAGSLAQSTGEPLRGFFVLNYRPRQRGLPPL